MIEALIAELEAIEDPRCEWKVEHRLLDILVIAVCAVLGEAESFEDIALRPLQTGVAGPVPGLAQRHPFARHLPPRADAGRTGRVRAFVPRLGTRRLPAGRGRTSAGGDRRQDRPALVRPPARPLAPAPGQRLRD